MSVSLAIGLVALTSLAVALLLLPLLARPSRPASRNAYNLAVYRDQLAEIERDAARGLLSMEQAEAARAEIGRRILALEPGQTEIAADAKPLGAAIIAILALPVAGLLLYAQLGSPRVADQPFAERRAPAATSAADDNPGDAEVKKALEKLRAHLQQKPDDLTGWLLLARTEMGLGRYQEAASAYGRAAELSAHRADISGDWGEALVLAAGGSVTPAARQAFEAGLKDPESAPRSRYYLALAQFQGGDARGALQAWVDLEADSPQQAEWLPLLRRRIAEAAAAQGIDPASLKTSRGGDWPAAPGAAAPAAAAPGAAATSAPPGTAGAMPSPEAVAAAAAATAGASVEERRAMIDTMVERLAARLEQQPDDAEGWTRLGRSYMVLQQPEKARDAYARAVKLKPGDAALKQALAGATQAVREGAQSGAPLR